MKTFKLFYDFLLIVSLAILTFNCSTAVDDISGNNNISGDNNNSGTTNEKVYYFTSDGVYLNGVKISSDLTNFEATLDEKINIYLNSTLSFFKNGIPRLPTNASYQQTCYYVDGTDIYEGGYELQTVSGYTLTRATYWKNGVKMPLEYDRWSDGVFICSVSSISKFNGEIYLSGISFISNLSNVPPYNMLWKNGKYVYPDVFYPYLAHQIPTTVKGQLILVAKDTNGMYRLYDINGSYGSDWFDASTAFSYMRCEFGEASYLVSTRIFKDIGYLKCRTGEVPLLSKYQYVVSCTYNGKDEYVCLGDRTTQNFNVVYKNGVKIELPLIFANMNVYKVIVK